MMPVIYSTDMVIPEATDNGENSEERDINEREKQKIEIYLRDGCGCVKNCSSHFDEVYLMKIRSDCAELTHDQLNLVVMGQLLSCVTESSETGVTRHIPHHRVRPSCSFLHGGVKV